MAIHYGPLMPPMAGVAVGDIFVSTINGNQQRCTVVGPPHTWVQLQPGETRADILPHAGTQDQILVRGVGVRPFDAGWADPGPGLIWEGDFTNLDTWSCDHALRNKYVSVLTIKDDGTVMIPDIDYVNATDNLIVLHFVEPVTGTCVIRR